MLREEYLIDGINCDPFTFDAECKELHARFHKNQNFNEIKSHHYIIRFDPKDRDEHGLTGEKAQQLGLEFVRRNFPGHQAPCDSRAGNKHHLTKYYLIYLKQSVMDMCQHENLYQVDLLSPSE